MFRLEDFKKIPDFETRANEFVKAINSLTEKFPNMVIVAKNKTLKDLDEGPSTIEWIRTEYPQFAETEWERDRETEIESSFKNVVIIDIGSETENLLYTFKEEADEIAKTFAGKKRLLKPFNDHGRKSRYLFRYDGELLYDFY